MTRRRLMPTRCMAETVDAEWEGHKRAVTLRFYDDGTIGEVFAQVATGGAMHATVADACVWASLAMQHGITPADDNEVDAIAILLWAIQTGGGVA